MPTVRPLLRLSIGSHLEEVDLVEVVVGSALDQVEIDRESGGWLVMAVREAVINAIRHGNREQPGKRVEVAVDSGPDELVVRVSDEGQGFDPDSLPDPREPENLLKPSGRGIFLMNQYLDAVEYSFPPSQGTVVTLRKRIAGPQEEERVYED